MSFIYSFILLLILIKICQLLSELEKVEVEIKQIWAADDFTIFWYVSIFFSFCIHNEYPLSLKLPKLSETFRIYPSIINLPHPTSFSVKVG